MLLGEVLLLFMDLLPGWQHRVKSGSAWVSYLYVGKEKGNFSEVVGWGGQVFADKRKKGILPYRSAAGRGTPCTGSGVKAAAWEGRCRSAEDLESPQSLRSQVESGI